ncbi:cyclic lactone autoinducer peptide [Ruminococcus sp.]|uniref:cyclic lactone autoinducer peptide n=1 Tax=Ruminococcus sp. TaxID=41978 RepID=UPI0025F3E090|nr:cyclic lactone autoinducer peptide [Ruminococcus sp.]
MKSTVNRFMMMFGGVFAAFALMIATISANSACMWITHQPKLPDDVKKLRKF